MGRNIGWWCVCEHMIYVAEVHMSSCFVFFLHCGDPKITSLGLWERISPSSCIGVNKLIGNSIVVETVGSIVPRCICQRYRWNRMGLLLLTKVILSDCKTWPLLPQVRGSKKHRIGEMNYWIGYIADRLCNISKKKTPSYRTGRSAHPCMPKSNKSIQLIGLEELMNEYLEGLFNYPVTWNAMIQVVIAFPASI